VFLIVLLTPTPFCKKEIGLWSIVQGSDKSRKKICWFFFATARQSDISLFDLVLKIFWSYQLG